MDFETLIREHYAHLVERAERILRGYDQNAAEDVVQAVFARLIQSGCSTLDDPLPYLCKSVQNEAIDLIRKVNRERENLGMERLPDEEQLATDQRAREETREEVRASLDILPHHERVEVIQRWWADFEFSQIAEWAESPIKTADSRYRSALARLIEYHAADECTQAALRRHGPTNIVRLAEQLAQVSRETSAAGSVGVSSGFSPGPRVSVHRWAGCPDLSRCRHRVQPGRINNPRSRFPCVDLPRTPG